MQLDTYQTWRLKQFERHRQALKQQTTTMPFVYVMNSMVDAASPSSVSRFLSVPALLEALFHDALVPFWQWQHPWETNQIVARCCVHKWVDGPLQYYASYVATCLDALVRPVIWEEDAEVAQRQMTLVLDRMPLLLLVDVLVYWQMAWIRQDPGMNRWSAQPWEPTAPSPRLWQYVEQRMQRRGHL